MINLSREFCQKIKDARRQAKLGQVEVALEVGCKQSALSAFENGDGTKLNDEVIRRLAEKFNVKILTVGENDPTEAVQGIPGNGANGEGLLAAEKGVVIVRGFCPNAHCPSNHGYQVDGRLFLRPDRAAADPVGGRFCALCGEVLVKRCPNCGAPVHDGAICSLCGDRYIVS